jgi:carbonic anhydrase
MDSYRRLLLSNKAWVQERVSLDPNFFLKFHNGQRPEFLWIGCSDSRVPAEEITGTQPGELFVHRNIANLVVHTDFNLMSVLEYAVDVLKVKHIIVCGHYGCGGVQNAFGRRHLGLINKWLRHIKDVYRFHAEELSQIEDRDLRVKRLVELNVLEQVHNLAETSFVQRAWVREQAPTLHGWVYDVETGYLKELITSPPGSGIEDIYAFDFEEPKTP